MNPDRAMVKLYNVKPVYCVECGKKLKDLPTFTYDPFTGEKINEGIFLMQCEDSWCAHYAAMTVDGWWKT